MAFGRKFGKWQKNGLFGVFWVLIVFCCGELSADIPILPPFLGRGSIFIADWCIDMVEGEKVA